MLPSRGLIQVDLDDPDIRAGSCNPPLAQVKILRRPKPSTDYSIDTDKSSRPNPGTVRTDIADKRPINNETPTFSEDQWPSIADAAKCSRSQANKLDSSAKELSPPDQVPKEPKIICKNNHVHQQIVNKKPMPIKSYKERADEYAKARLRILGSAFSEEDKSDGDKPKI